MRKGQHHHHGPDVLGYEYGHFLPSRHLDLGQSILWRGYRVSEAVDTAAERDTIRRTCGLSFLAGSRAELNLTHDNLGVWTRMHTLKKETPGWLLMPQWLVRDQTMFFRESCKDR